MDIRAEEAYEELHRDSDRRNAAHEVTIRVAADKPHRRRFNGKSCCWCRYCGGRWTWDDRA